MAHQHKIIAFNDHKELWKIKYILEEIVDNIENSQEEYAKKYHKIDIVGFLVDGLEEESYFLKYKDIKPRNLCLVNVYDLNVKYDSNISIYYGYLNSKDSFLEPECYKIIAEELRNFVLNSGRCKDETIELLLEFTNVLLGEYEAYKNNKPYFKVMVEK